MTKLTKIEFDELSSIVRNLDAEASLERSIKNEIEDNEVLRSLLKDKFNDDIFNLADFINKNSRFVNKINISAVATYSVDTEIFENDNFNETDIAAYVSDLIEGKQIASDFTGIDHLHTSVSKCRLMSLNFD